MNSISFEGANDLIILVNDNDEEVGIKDKVSVHQLGLLHRAFSVFVFNSKNELLLQQRADGKYHSPGLWTNTCCSHPFPGENTIDACQRRLLEEMNLKCELRHAFSFIYRYKFSNGLIEHEFDHVYVGKSDDIPVLNKNEAKDWKYITLNNLEREIILQPENFTEWLKICFPRLIEHTKSYQIN
jgi:isopentenyl-diphosphate delta-isomerase